MRQQKKSINAVHGFIAVRFEERRKRETFGFLSGERCFGNERNGKEEEEDGNFAVNRRREKRKKMVLIEEAMEMRMK